MIRFYAERFLFSFRTLAAIRTLGADYGNNPFGDPEGSFEETVRSVLEQFKELKMPLSVSATERLLENIRPGIPLSVIATGIADLTNRAIDELAAVRLVNVSQADWDLYERKGTVR